MPTKNDGLNTYRVIFEKDGSYQRETIRAKNIEEVKNIYTDVRLVSVEFIED